MGRARDHRSRVIRGGLTHPSGRSIQSQGQEALTEWQRRVSFVRLADAAKKAGPRQPACSITVSRQLAELA